MRIKKYFRLIILLPILMNTSCSDANNDFGNMTFDCSIFDGTPMEGICQPIIEEDLDEIETFFSEHPEYLNLYIDSLYYSPLKLAAVLNKKESLKKLFEIGADPNIRTSLNSIVLIDGLTVKADKETIEILLENGADASYINSQKKAPFKTPLSVPAIRTDIYFMLIEYGADPNYRERDKLGGYKSHLIDAVLTFRYEIAYKLLNNYRVDYDYDFSSDRTLVEFINDYLSKKQPPLLSDKQLEYRDSILIFLENNHLNKNESESK